MKSKSFEVPKFPADMVKQNKTYDFVNFYKSASETCATVDKRKSDDGSSKENFVSNKLHTLKHVPNKKKNRNQNDSVDVSKININGDSLLHSVQGSFLDDSKVTSTPKAAKKDAEPKVKPIIKNKSLIDSSLNVSNVSISSKPKKRNKSVSFLLDDTEGVVLKRSKSEESISKPDKSSGKIKKSKKKLQDEKENGMVIDIVPMENVATTSKQHTIQNNNTEIAQNLASSDSLQTKERKKRNKLKKAKNIAVESESPDVLKSEVEEPKLKKTKKKKRHIKSVGTDNIQTEGEPAQKSSKKDVKPEKIVQDLESLNIGDNTHTLTNLLDEMTVVDKNKKKKIKKDNERKQKKDKPLSATSINSDVESMEKIKKGKSKKQKKKEEEKTNANNVSQPSINTESGDTEEKEKVKWVKRKWNKDKKGGANVDKHLTSVIIENLPLALMFTYRKLLAEHFVKFGMIRQVGIAELYPTEEPKPVFTTTINFYSEDAAEKALEDDNTVFEGARIRIKRPLPPTLTTLVVRSYAELTEQALSSVFSSAGRIRNIRQLIKGKKSLSTAFIEFDAPKSVERAIKMAEDAKIGGKKIHVAKYELRVTSKKPDKSQHDSEGSDSSNE